MYFYKMLLSVSCSPINELLVNSLEFLLDFSNSIGISIDPTFRRIMN